jgi:hypothetical protein
MSHALFHLLPTSLATLQLTSNSFAALPEDFFLTRPHLDSFDLGRGFADPPDHVSAGRAAFSEYFAAKRLDGSERTGQHGQDVALQRVDQRRRDVGENGPRRPHGGGGDPSGGAGRR